MLNGNKVAYFIYDYALPHSAPEASPCTSLTTNTSLSLSLNPSPDMSLRARLGTSLISETGPSTMPSLVPAGLRALSCSRMFNSSCCKLEYALRPANEREVLREATAVAT